MEHTYKIAGMTCSNCRRTVETLLGNVAGIEKVDIDLQNGQARILMGRHIPTVELQNALKEHPKYSLSEMQAATSARIGNTADTRSWVQTYKPILLILAYILAVSAIAASSTHAFDPMLAMRVFMAGFFLVFSFFKMLDLTAFAESYAMYDVVARRFKGWGYIYAVIELSLGLAYALNFQPFITNTVTIAVMSISIIGVLQSVLNKRQIRCACLGAVFNLPMSTVTIIEDGLMIAMSAVTLVML